MSASPVKTNTLAVHLGHVGSGSMTSGSAVLHSPGAFKPSDVNRYVTVMGCGTAIPIGDGKLPPYPNPSFRMTNQVMLVSYVIGYSDADHVTLHDSAVCTFDGVTTGDSNMTIFRPIVTDVAGGTGCLSGSISWDSTLTARDTAQFSVFSEDGTFQVKRGMPVLITDTEDTVNNIFPPLPGPLFGGIVDQIKAHIESKHPSVTFDCSCVSWDVIMDRRLVGTYQSAYSGAALAVITSLIYYHAGAEGFNVIQDGPTGPNLGFLSYDYGSSVSSALDDVVTKSYGLGPGSPSAGTYSYQWYIDPWKRVYFVLQNTALAPFQCEDVTGDGSFGDYALAVTVTDTGEKLANRVFVASSKQLMPAVTETFTGSSSGDTSFSTANPIGALPAISDSRYGSQTVGVYGVDAGGTYDWYFQESNSTIYQDTSGTREISPPTKTTTITVTYQGEANAFDYYQNDEGVGTQAAVSGGTGFCDYLINLDTVSQAGPPSDGMKLATSVANSYGTPPTSLDLTTWRGGLRCAQLIAVKLAQFGINANFLIDRVQLATDGNIKTWTIHAVDGPLIGDWRTAMIDLAGGSSMIGAGGANNFPTEAPGAWVPNYEAPNANNPVTSDKGFGVTPVYDQASGVAVPLLEIYGDPPPAGIGLEFKIRWEPVSGCAAQVASAVVAVSSGSPSVGKVSLGAAGLLTTDQFKGRIMSKLANPQEVSPGVAVPICDFLITGNNTVGDFTVTPDPTLSGCAAGDLFTIRTGGLGAVTTPITAGTDWVEDLLFASAYNPTPGLTANGNIGDLLLIDRGKGAGQSPRTVTANTGVRISVSPDWEIVPDKTSCFVLLEAAPQPPIPVDLSATAGNLIGRLSITNYGRKVVRVEGYTTNGRTGGVETVTFRELFSWGVQGSRRITASTTLHDQLPTDRIVLFDTDGVTPPTATTLTADISSDADTTISVATGTNLLNGIYLQVGSEIMYVVDGGGTTSLTVERAQLGSAAPSTSPSHASGAAVTMGGALTYTLLPITQISNQGLKLSKDRPLAYTGIANDLNYVKILPDSGGDELPDGASYIILSDTSSGRGTVTLDAPGV